METSKQAGARIVMLSQLSCQNGFGVRARSVAFSTVPTCGMNASLSLVLRSILSLTGGLALTACAQGSFQCANTMLKNALVTDCAGTHMTDPDRREAAGNSASPASSAAAVGERYERLPLLGSLLKFNVKFVAKMLGSDDPEDDDVSFSSPSVKTVQK